MRLAVRRLRLVEPAGFREVDLRSEDGAARALTRLPGRWPEQPGLRPPAVEPLTALDRALGATHPAAATATVERSLLLELELADRAVVVERALGRGPDVAELHEADLEGLDAPHVTRLLPTEASAHSRSVTGFLLAHAGLAGLGECAGSETGTMAVEPTRIERLPRFAVLPDSSRSGEGERRAVAALVRLVLGLSDAVGREAQKELERLSETIAALEKRHEPEAEQIALERSWSPAVAELLSRYEEAQERLRRRTAELSVLRVERPRRLGEWDELIQERARLKALEEGATDGPPLVCSRCHSVWPDGGHSCGACGEAESRPLALTDALVAVELRLSSAQEMSEQLDNDIELAEQLAERARSISTRIHISLVEHLLAHEVLGVAANGGGNISVEQHAELHERSRSWSLSRHQEAKARLGRRLERLGAGRPASDELRGRLEGRIAGLHDALGERTYAGSVGADLLPEGTGRGDDGQAILSRDGWLVWQLALFQELHESELAAPGLLVLEPEPGAGERPAAPSVFERVNGKLEASLGEWLEGPGAGSQIVLVTAEDEGA